LAAPLAAAVISMPHSAGSSVHAGAHTLSAKYAAFAKKHADLLRLVESIVQVRAVPQARLRLLCACA
jgi:hypothetical protein